ncbi:MAG: nucleotidyltransferase domain-containing protein [Promethearchaeati archaeon SRVP18_Atabeyarchaeia-1]
MLKILKAKLEVGKLVYKWRPWAKKIAGAAKVTLGECQVYVFGSVAKGTATGASDVDILIVCREIPKGEKSRGNAKARLEELAGLPLYHPFEIHLATREEAQANPIYRTAIREGILQ